MCRHGAVIKEPKSFKHEDTVIKLIHNPCGCSQCRETVGTIRLCACGIGELETNTRGTQSFLAGDIVEIQIDAGGNKK